MILTLWLFCGGILAGLLVAGAVVADAPDGAER